MASVLNYERITQAAVALHSATTATGASPQRHDVTQQDAVTWRNTSETAYFGGRKKFFILWPTHPKLLGQDFVINFVTYMRVYTVV